MRHEVVRFGVVGVVSVAVDVAMFNLLHLVLGLGPLTAKTASVLVATTTSYAGNRHWSFRHRARSSAGRSYFLFLAVNAAGLLVALGSLAVARYALGLTDAVSLNVAANVVGLALATLFRFWAYRRWVFPAPDGPPFSSLQPLQAAASGRG